MSILKIIKKDLSNIPEALVAYDDMLDTKTVNSDIRISNNTALDVNVNQTTCILKYGFAASQCKTLMDFIDLETKKLKTILHKELIENHNLALTHRERENLFDDNEEYVKIQILFLEVKERYSQFTTILEALTARGYAMKNITTLLVEHLGHTVL